MYRISAVALYAFSLVVILLALARGSPALGASVLVLGATIGDLRVSRKSTSTPSPKRNLLRRALRRVGAQIVLSAFVLLDIGGLGLALIAPAWLAPWVTINLTALVVGSLSWSEERRLQRESATAMQRQAEKVRAAEQQKLEEREHKAEGRQPAERAEGLRQTEQQPGEDEKRLRLEGKELEAQKQQHTEQAERLRKLEQQLREAEQQRRQEEEWHEAQRQQQAEQAERLRQAEQQLREAEWRRRQEEREAHRKCQREGVQAAAQFQADWWIVLGVAPSASKDEIARNYRHRIKQYHPDRIAGLAPEFLQLAEDRTKALNEAYANAARARWLSAA